MFSLRYVTAMAVVAVTACFLGLLGICFETFSPEELVPFSPETQGGKSFVADWPPSITDAVRRAHAIEKITNDDPFAPTLTHTNRDNFPGDLPAAFTKAWNCWSSSLDLAEQCDVLLHFPEEAYDKAELQRIFEALTSLQNQAREQNNPTNAPLAALIDRQIVRARKLIAQIEAREAMERCLGALRQAHAQQDYERCLQQCNLFVNQYSALADRATLDEVYRLRQLAESEVARLLAARRALEKLRSEQMSSLEIAVIRAGRVAETYPQPEIRRQLETILEKWAEYFLPPKKYNDPPEIQEIEWQNQDGKSFISRGFVREVRTVDGQPGYQVFETAADRNNPHKQTGTIRADQVVAGPSKSLPQQCAEQYTAARTRLLADIQRIELWEDLARVCRELDTKLKEYRQKPGHASNSLDFAREAAMLEKVLTPENRARLKTILAP